MTTVRAWYLHGIDFKDAPASYNELASRFSSRDIETSLLRPKEKWETKLQGMTSSIPDGWVLLSDLAKTRRGTATGANNFFLVSRLRATELRLREQSMVPCVGRAADVLGYIFSSSDMDALLASGGKALLLDFKDPLSPEEAAYVAEGEAEKVNERFLCKVRTPWYSMEPGSPAPIWAAVFGRGDLKFVHNSAGVRSLTNFHAVVPKTPGRSFAEALTFCLNAPAVRTEAALHLRSYGGGLRKFEPNDLKGIPVPDLRLLDDALLARLAEGLHKLHAASVDAGQSDTQGWVDELVAEAGAAAAKRTGLR